MILESQNMDIESTERMEARNYYEDIGEAVNIRMYGDDLQ